MKTIVITPARYASTRFPGKPLAKLGGREIILRVMDRIAEAGYPGVVATDDERIFTTVKDAGYLAVMTRSDHQSGTDRVCEALDRIESLTGEKYDVVINVQGDEPFIDPEQIHDLEQCFEDASTDIATLGRVYPATSTYAGLADPNLVKLVKSPSGRALYFSRSVIPYLRGVKEQEWPRCHKFFTHIGIYGYRSDTLREISALPKSPLETEESLEQLRWLENGYNIKVAESEKENIGIDTPEDLANAEMIMQKSFGEKGKIS
ncbi:MAG: 3-deoxy-manno-octulosonate cytidylyltransferase [Muribaculaceae bacterium]|nr:3-deoxy-manno-octulosonate cytidylyltransferase [Muribaculaceae bacterium]MDE6559042.1 3-deoxy-manno-octulosonate cytidylyltransferase [Muribaculaceae bacterium]